MKERTRAKIAGRATKTSDVTRARILALAALGAAVGTGAALAAGAVPRGTDKPVARPHERAHVACGSCHTDPASSASASSASLPSSRLVPSSASSAGAAVPYAAAGACKACHAKTEHVSTRSPHKALAQRGELPCAGCHPAHAGAQGITFDGDGSFVRWGAGNEEHVALRSGPPVAAGTTVPLVALSVCVRCHAAAKPTDPIAKCVPAEIRSLAPPKPADANALTDDERAKDAAWKNVLATTPSRCFDEHRSFANAEKRFVAWDAAREAASKSSWVPAATTSAPPWTPLGAALAGASVLGGLALLGDRRRRSPSQGAAAPTPQVPAARKKLPVVNPSTCLGCYACVDVCPFDVLTIEKYVAVVARPDECCGVVLCEQVCPNGSLTIAEGEAIVDRPLVDENLESRAAPGVYLAGDLTGLPLIKNAINQGVRVVDRIAASLPRRSPTDGNTFDVVIVGAGPAGLSAALRAQERGLSYVVLEQATVAASVKSFPRDKIVYDPPLDLPVMGELWLREGTKEELLGQWMRIVRTRALDVREGTRVLGLERTASGFDVRTTDGSRERTVRAARVVLAIGRRGTPRRLDLTFDPSDPRAEEHVSYALADARSLVGKRVVIAGLGDTAMEAAIAIARQPETSVTITYRGSSFTRGKKRNVEELQDLVAKGRVRVLFETVPVHVTRTSITLEGTTKGKGGRTLQADVLLVLVGGVPSWDLLERCGIPHPVAGPRSDIQQ